MATKDTDLNFLHILSTYDFILYISWTIFFSLIIILWSTQLFGDNATIPKIWLKGLIS